MEGTAGTALDDTWIWDGTAWSERHPMHHPSARKAPSLAWTQLRFDTIAPPARPYASLIPAQHGLVVTGGYHGFVFGLPTFEGNVSLLRWIGDGRPEACGGDAVDLDGDGQSGCVDLDCWQTCTPLCSPGVTCN